MVRESVLNDFVGHIEAEFDIPITDTARDVLRRQSRGCRGERLLAIALVAAQRIGQPVSTVLESFGRACADARCGRELMSQEPLNDLVRELALLTGDDASLACRSQGGDQVDIVVVYRDGAGCGDVVAGLLSAWLEAHVAYARISRRELSPVPGSHIRFHLTGEMN